MLKVLSNVDGALFGQMMLRSSFDGSHNGVLLDESSLSSAAMSSSSLVATSEGGVSGPFRNLLTRSCIDIGFGSRPSSVADNFCLVGRAAGGGTGCGGKLGSTIDRCEGVGTGRGGEEAFLPN